MSLYIIYGFILTVLTRSTPYHSLSILLSLFY